MPLSLESDFLKLIEESKEQRAALLAALELVRRFQGGDPSVWMDAAKTMPMLEAVEKRLKERAESA